MPGEYRRPRLRNFRGRLLSTDRTRDIARSCRRPTLVHDPFENYAAQRNWAQVNLPARSDWVLHLDADASG